MHSLHYGTMESLRSNHRTEVSDLFRSSYLTQYVYPETSLTNQNSIPRQVIETNWFPINANHKE